MEIYIPENLKKITVISQLCTMIEGYAGYYEEDPRDSFDDYDFYLSHDPVKAFISLCIPIADGESEEHYITVNNYLSRMFYSVKGTRLVLEYMKKFLDLKFTEGKEIIYRPGQKIEFSLDTIPVNDAYLFRDLLEGFLNALLYWSVLDVNVAKVELKVENTIKSYIQGGAITYTFYVPTPIDDAWNDNNNTGNNI